MDNNFRESKPNLSRAPQETELENVPVSQWPSQYKMQVRNLEFQLTSVSRGRGTGSIKLASLACGCGYAAMILFISARSRVGVVSAR